MKSTPSDLLQMEISNTRVFHAPRETVFNAFANPKHVAHWWGPNGFTNTIREFDLRPGGAWRFTMHGPDGATYDNAKEFLEVTKPARIVFRHLQPMHSFQMEMTFEDLAGTTRLRWHMVFAPHPDNAKLKAFITGANEQNFDRLAAYLEKHRQTIRPD